MSDLPQRLHCVVALWGEVFIQTFLEVTLPSLLTEGNLYGLGARTDPVLRILTVPDSVERLRLAPQIVAASRRLPVEVCSVSDLDLHDVDAAASACHRQAVRDADEEGAALIVLTPDSLWSEGAFQALLDRAESGVRAVLVASIRVQLETFAPAYVGQAKGGSLSSRELVRLGLQHLHPISESLFWDSEHFSSHPSHVYWRVGGDGLVARCFHLHPLYVFPMVRGGVMESNIDDDYLIRAVPDLGRVHVVTDSDELCGFELSPANKRVGHSDKPRSASALAVAAWARRGANKHHRDCFRSSVSVHAGSLGGAQQHEWERARAEARDLAFRVRCLLATPIPTLPGTAERVVTRLRAAVTTRVVAAKRRLGVEGDLLGRKGGAPDDCGSET